MRRRLQRGRKRLQRHARNAILAMLLATAGSFAGMAWATQKAGAWLRDPLYADKECRFFGRVAAKGQPLTVVMLGSSRTSNALRGTDLEVMLEHSIGRPVVAFNFGVPSSGPITQTLYLKRLLAAGLRPDLVLFEIMPPLLAGQLPDPIESHFFAPERLMPGEVEFAVAHGYPADKFRDGERIADWAPIYGLRLPILGRYFSSWSPWNLRFDSSRNSDETGWMKPVFDPVTPEQYARGVDWAQKEYSLVLQTLRLEQSPAARSVGEAIAACRSANVPVQAIILPEGTAFRAMYPPHALAKLDDFTTRLECPLVDARLWLGDDGFSDSHHMVSAGSREFTRKLGETIIRQNLLRGRE
jgi:hypothetical protein